MLKNASFFILLLCSVSCFTACAKKTTAEKKNTSKASTRASKKALTASPVAALPQPKAPVIRGKVVDKIVCRVNGVNITMSDLAEPRIDKNGDTYTIDEAIAEELLIQKAAELKIIPTEVEIERRIIAIKQANGFLNKPEEEFEAWLAQEARLTQRKLKQQLMRTGAAAHVKGWNATESGVVSEKEKREFFAKHPIKALERFHLKTAFVDDENLDEAGNLIDASELIWTDIGWVEKDELSEPMSFVASLQKNEVSKPVKTEYGYQMVELLDRQEPRNKTYEESESIIEKKLIKRKQKRGDSLLINKLRKQAAIVMLP